MPMNEKQRTKGMAFFRTHWVGSWFGIGLISYVVITISIYWLLMHGFSISENGSYDRATSVATIIQATLAAAGLLAVSAALLAIARNTDRTYDKQLEQQKWQRREEFAQFAESVLQKGLETYTDVAHGVLQQIGINVQHFHILREKEELSEDSLNDYLQHIKMHEWDAKFREQAKELYSNLHARAIAHSPFWKPRSTPQERDALRLDVDAEPASVPLVALTACPAFLAVNQQSVDNLIKNDTPADRSQLLDQYADFYSDSPLAPWLHPSYFSRYASDLTNTDTAPFPALIALIDMLPSLLNIVAYLEQYHLADAEDHPDSRDHQLERFKQYLRIPSLKPLCEIHKIASAEALYRHLFDEVSSRGQFEANDTPIPPFLLSKARRRELQFWFGRLFELFFFVIYQDVLSPPRSNQNSGQDENPVSPSAFDDWFDRRAQGMRIDEIAYFYRYKRWAINHDRLSLECCG